MEEMANLAFLKVHHVGIMVKDIDKAMEQYRPLVSGPWGSIGRNVTEREVYGKPVGSAKNIARIAPMGPILLELVQPVSGESIQKAYIEKMGEGINHVAFTVKDLNSEVAKMKANGYRMAAAWKYAEGGGGVYLETVKVEGTVIELIQTPPR